MSRPERPAAVVVGVPGMPAGLAVTTCDRCRGRFRINVSTALTLAQAGAARPPVYCFACATALGLFNDPELIGNAEGRTRLGLDN